MQTTLKAAVTFTGVGLHSGRLVRMRLNPAFAEHGIWFRRTDIQTGDQMIAARWDNVVASELCTKIANADGVEISTIEHIMAAVAGTGLNNVMIEVDGPEVPILDGSAAPFVEGILSKGLIELDAPSRAIEILKPVEVRRGDAVARLSPADGYFMSFMIDFADRAIGHQTQSLNMMNGTFVRELCDSRTFCRQSDVDAMQARGLALGGSLENAVVVDGDQVLSPGGFRHEDEAVRHKMLDALGDLLLAGAPLLGHYEGNKAGHALTNHLLRALFADPEAYRLVTCDDEAAARLPGVGVSRSDLQRVAA